MLQSLVDQTKRPERVIIVNDNSTDHSQQIIDKFTSQYHFITSIFKVSEDKHSPGAKVIDAFYEGYNSISETYDFIGKFDADIILPANYVEQVLTLFASNPKVGIAGGNLYINKNGSWIFEAISEKTKVRGPIKLYRKACFEDIGGLKKSIGWDTVDGLLASYYGWESVTNVNLHVKHLKPTGNTYHKSARKKQGEAFYRMRYSKNLARIAALKLALAKNDLRFYFTCMRGYQEAKNKATPFIVTKQEGIFINNFRWENIKKKIL